MIDSPNPDFLLVLTRRPLLVRIWYGLFRRKRLKEEQEWLEQAAAVIGRKVDDQLREQLAQSMDDYAAFGQAVIWVDSK